MIGFGLAFHEHREPLAREMRKVLHQKVKAFCINARVRCTNSKLKHFKNYGGRGIEYRIPSPEVLIAAIGLPPSLKHSGDRIDVNGHYEIGNLRWATQSEQMENVRHNAWVTIEGKSYKRVELVKKYGVTADRIDYGAKVGWPLEKIVSQEKQYDTSSLPLAVAAIAEKLRGKPVPWLVGKQKKLNVCRAGLHPLIDGNLHMQPDGSRKCRQCSLNKRNARYAKRSSK